MSALRPHRLRLVGLYLLCGTLAAVAGKVVGIMVQRPTIIATSSPISDEHVEALEVADGDLSLGNISDSNICIHNLVIRNSTTSEVEVVGIDPGCSCTKVVPKTLKIPASGEAKIQLEVQLDKSISVSSVSNVTMQYEVRIPIRCDYVIDQGGARGGMRSSRFVLHGTFTPRLAFQAQSIDFGDEASYLATGATRSVQYNMARGVNPELLSFEIEPGVANVAVEDNKWQERGGPCDS